MSSLYLKLAALGVTGVTVATVVPISVLKSSGSENPSQIEQQLDSNPSGSLGEVDRTHKNAHRADSSSSSASEASVQAVSSEEAPKIKKCKDIASGSEGKLEMCYNKESDKKVKFTFFEFLGGTSRVNSYYNVGNLSASSSNNLYAEVLKIDDGGKRNRTVSLSLFDEVTSEGSLVLRERSFNQDKCFVEWITEPSKGIKTNWKVICEASNNK